MFKPVAVAAGMIAGGFLLATAADAQPPRPGAGPDRDSVRCESKDYRLNRCNVDWRDGRLVRQTSSSRCVRGQNWGVDRRGLWVDRGCGGVFVEAGRGPGGPGPGPGPGGPGGWQPGPGWDGDFRLTCQSNDFRYRMCQIDIGPGGRVRIERQLSETACIEGRTWGFNRAGVWVDRGCAAVFGVDRRWR
ncbi:MAG: DUF3011 domain-containing protein [Xanthomonadales bacterium]|nr:DUF3011 domain-containing protein [Xanthomonadales bacterium]